jgi:ATP-dependent RNA helicase RhlE
VVRPPPVSRDPFFDKPYEEPVAAKEVAPWEPSAPPAARSISANIKPKRRVAALFKPEPQVTEPPVAEPPVTEHQVTEQQS